jgi:hypothetical protein
LAKTLILGWETMMEKGMKTPCVNADEFVYENDFEMVFFKSLPYLVTIAICKVFLVEDTLLQKL